MLALPAAAWAKVYIDLSAPSERKVPLAIQDFKDLGSKADQAAVNAVRKELYDTLKSDLDFSNLFSVIDKAAYIEDPKAGLTEAGTSFRDWRAVGADALIKGGFSVDGDKVVFEVRFFDCLSEKQVVGKRFSGRLNNARKVAHFFADQLYEELTGKKGIFTTNIMFVSDKTGSKEVYIADYDGKNAIQITKNGSINLFPQWAPDGKSIIYVSYKKKFPYIYRFDLKTGKDTVVSSKPGINIGARFSPDGKKIALTLSSEKSPELFTLDLETREYRKLTDNFGIDVSASWSPDGRLLAYTSDTAGNPHVFVLDLTTGNYKRLTFDGAFNSSPAWSPDGKQIAFSRQDNGRFNIWVMQADGISQAQMTFEGDNRNPSWSPDGRYIVFSSARRGRSSLYIMRSDGTGLQRLDTGTGNEKSPVWSPFMQ